MRFGGLARRATWISQIREQEKKEPLIVDAGDLFFKKYEGPLQEQEMRKRAEQAILIAESLELMGYNAVGIGDDDLSLGKEFLLNLSKKVSFPFLSSNLFDEATGKPLFQTSLIQNRDGLRMGIFSLLSPETFQNPSDPRKNGILLRSPMEVAQAMVKELQPKTDLILLLSHLGYPKDVQLAQTIPGIHLIIGGHSGVNLVNPSLINRSLLLQMSPKGLYGGRLNLTLYSKDSLFWSASEKRTLETGLHQLRERILFLNVNEIETWLQNYLGPYSRMQHLARVYQISFPEELIQNMKDLSVSLKAKDFEKEKVLRVKVKEEAEQILAQLRGRNEFSHFLTVLGDQFKDHPEIQKKIETFRTKYPELQKTIPPPQEAPRFQGGTSQN